MITNLIKLFMIGSILLFTNGCATLNTPPEEHDPWERFNRSMYNFNDSVDRNVLKPVAKGYRKITPDPVEHGFSNFFNNLKEIRNLINALLQGKVVDALSDTGRFITNTTLGIGGFFDVATHFGLEQHNEDFGQTLGKWGVGDGPYLVLPFFGPSSARDGFGFAGDQTLHPIRLVENHESRRRLTFYTLSAIDARAQLLGTGDLIDQAALDPYIFIREAYLQRRLKQINDGKVSEQEEEEFDIFDEPQ